jgi:hypothetical protein
MPRDIQKLMDSLRATFPEGEDDEQRAIGEALAGVLGCLLVDARRTAVACEKMAAKK